METYFRLKTLMEVIPIIVFVLIIVIGITRIILSIIKDYFIEKFFVSHGYKRELFGVPSFGGGAFYGWVRESDNMRVDDRDIEGWSLIKIIREYR